MKIRLILLATVIFLHAGCEDVKISGKTESEWVEKLNDLDPMIQSQAIRALSKAPQPVIESAKARLIEIALKRIDVSSEAAILLAVSMVEMRPEFASLYLRPTRMTHGIPDGGGEAIIYLSLDYPDIAQKEVRRRLAESTDPADTEELKLILASMTTEQPSDSESTGSDDRDSAQDNRGYYDQ